MGKFAGLFKPVTVLGEFVGDAMIETTKAIVGNRPCEKKAKKHGGLRTGEQIGDALGKVAHIDFSTPEYKMILQSVVDGKLWIVADVHRDYPDTIVWMQTFTKDVIQDFAKYVQTGPDAIGTLFKVKFCGTEANLERKWAKFGMGPQQNLLSFKRVQLVAKATGTILVMGAVAGPAYAAATASATAALAGAGIATNTALASTLISSYSFYMATQAASATGNAVNLTKNINLKNIKKYANTMDNLSGKNKKYSKALNNKANNTKKLQK